MSFAEKKLELIKIVTEADEDTTAKLIEFANWLQKGTEPSSEDVIHFEQKRDDFFASGEKGLSKDESLALLRDQLK